MPNLSTRSLTEIAQYLMVNDGRLPSYANGILNSQDYNWIINYATRNGYCGPIHQMNQAFNSSDEVNTNTGLACLSCRGLDNLDNNQICSRRDCRDNYYAECYHCHTEECRRNMQGFDNTSNRICDECQRVNPYRRCSASNCRNIRLLTEIIIWRGSDSNGDRHWCDVCFNTRSFECVQCNQRSHRDHYGLNGWCQNCVNQSGDAGLMNFQIQGWGFKPTIPKFFGDTDDHLYIGMELEVEVQETYRKEDVAYQLALAIPEVYIKSDASLKYGFEIVTHPMSYKYFHNSFNMDPIEQLAKDKKCFSFKKTCGLHFHLSKAAFTTRLHQYKFLKFFYQNQDFCEVVGQRKFNQYCQKVKDLKTSTLTSRAFDARNHERHEFLNLQNKETIELRFFKGNLIKARILKNIEFIKSAFEFTKITGISSLSVENYIQYVLTSKDYQHLTQFLKKRKLEQAQWKEDQDWIVPESKPKKEYLTEVKSDWTEGKSHLVPQPKQIYIKGYGSVYGYTDFRGKQMLFKNKDTYTSFYMQEHDYRWRASKGSADYQLRLIQSYHQHDQWMKNFKKEYENRALPKFVKPTQGLKYNVSEDSLQYVMDMLPAIIEQVGGTEGNVEESMDQVIDAINRQYIRRQVTTTEIIGTTPAYSFAMNNYLNGTPTVVDQSAIEDDEDLDEEDEE